MEQLTCKDCGCALERKPGRGRPPERCDSCFDAHYSRAYWREKQAARRARIKAERAEKGPPVCPCGCGATVERDGQRCPEAAAEQADYDKTRP